MWQPEALFCSPCSSRGLVVADPAFEVVVGTASKASYLLGEKVEIPGSVEFADMDPSQAEVTLVIDGPQPVAQPLPVIQGTYSYPANNLEVTVSSKSVSSTIGTLPGGSLPGGPVEGTRIEYGFEWTPPMFLDPAPEYTLLPELTQAFPIPVVTPTPLPGVEGLADLPATVEKFPIPLVGTPEPGQPSALPGVELAFAVPVIPTPSPAPDAPDPLPALTAAFAIPLAPTPVPEQGAPPDLPTLTEAFDVPAAATPTPESGAATPLDQSITAVFTIPSAPTPTAVAGVAELPSTTLAFAIPNSKSPRGIATDGTDFYILVDGSPDQIYKVDSSGALVTGFDTDGIIDVTQAAQFRSSAEGIAYVGGSLYVSEGSWRDDGVGGYSILKFNATTGAEVTISTDNSCAIPNFDRFSGIHADGTRLWGIVDWGGKFVKITTDCTEVTSYNPWPYNAAHGLAVGSGDHPFFFVSEGETIVKRNKSDASDAGASWTLSTLIIKGLTYDGGLLYLADADSKNVYKTNIPHGQTVTTDPRGVAYDGTYLYILVDASPNDKIIVVDSAVSTSTPPTIVRSFDAPSSSGDALTYADGFLWLGQATGCCNREIKKIDPQAGNVAATLTLENPIWNSLGGLGQDGTGLVGFTKTDRDIYTISKSNGDAVRIESDGTQEGFQAGTYRTSNNRSYAGSGNKIYEFLAGGEQRQIITLSPATVDIKGMTFIGPNIFFVDDYTNKVYKGSVPHGISITTDPLALAANGTTTLFILVDGSPRDKVLLVDPATGSITSSYDAPDDDGKGLTYLNGSLYYATNKGQQHRILELNPTTGAQLSSMTPQYPWGDIFDNLLGLTNDGSDLIVSTSRDDFWNQCLEVVDPISGQNEGSLCSGNGSGLGQAAGVALAPDGFILAAEDDEIVQLSPEGDENARWSGLVSATDIQGLTFVGGTLYLSDAGTGKILKATVPSGIQVTTNPLALAYGTANNTTTMFILVDATPFDKILLVDPADGSLRSSYNAPDDNGEGLTYLSGSLYYASNKENPRRVYELNPSTGAQLTNFTPQNQWGDISDSLLGLGNDGTDLILSTNNPWDPCLEQVNSTNGSNQRTLCADWQEGITQARGVAVASDGFILAAKDDEIVQLTAEGKENTVWLNLASVTDIEGLTFVSSTLYVADDGSDTIYKATVPSGRQVTTDPLALAYGTADSTSTLFVLVDAVPVDKVLLVDPDDGSLNGSYDAPDGNGEGLTYLGTSLYYAGRDEFGSSRIYELNPDTGAELGSITPRYDWGGEIFENPRSLANDGTDLLIYFGNNDCIQQINKTTGDSEGQLCPQIFEHGLSGARGLADSSDGSLFSARSTKVAQLVTVGQQDLVEVGRWNTTSSADYEGLVFVAEVLYLADDETNGIYKASKPSGITNNPRGMAYDGTNLYILVDGGLTDHILVVDPTTGAVVTSFDAPHRDSSGITHMVANNTPTLFVSATKQEHWGRVHRVYRISPTDGSEIGAPMDVFAEEWVDGWRGLTNDCRSLILAPNMEGFVILLDPNTGDYERRIDFYGGPFFGFGAIAYHQSPKDFLATSGSDVLQVDDDGRLLQSFPTGLSQLKGAAFVGNALYLAEGLNKTVQAASIPAPPTTISTSPKGMATDGTKLYVLVDGSPKDRILVLAIEDGAVLSSFEAPGDNTNGLAWHGALLYAVTNEFHPQYGDQPARILAIDPQSGQVVQESDILAPWGLLFDRINGLASDGVYLYAGSRWGPEWFRIDPNSLGSPATQMGGQGDFMWAHYVGSLEMAEVPGVPTTLLSSGHSDGGPVITRFDLDSGAAIDQFPLGNRSIEGMAYVDTALYLADANNDAIFVGTLPDNIPEITTVGDYEAILRVVSGQITRESDLAASFSIVRNPVVLTEMTEPLPNFATTSSVIPIAGRVNDPSIQNVTVGVILPFTTLLEDDVTQGSSPALWDAEGLWYVDCSPFWEPPLNSSEPCRWRFGEINQPGFGRGVRAQGSLTTNDAIAVGPGTRLSFSTWYSTEPVPESDLKLVEVAIVTTDGDGNDVVGQYQALRQIVGFGFWGAPVPHDDQGQPLYAPHNAFEHTEVEQEWVEWAGGCCAGEVHPLRFVLAPGVEDLDAPVLPVRYVHPAVSVYGDIMNDIELAGGGP